MDYSADKMRELSSKNHRKWMDIHETINEMIFKIELWKIKKYIERAAKKGSFSATVEGDFTDTSRLTKALKDMGYNVLYQGSRYGYLNGYFDKFIISWEE